jgi:uncharacterized protein YecE (DUF72 family)
MMFLPAIHIGTSGWHYKHWIGTFYPEDLRPERWLEFYSRRLDTVEINNSFYHLPLETTFSHWRETVPENFRFAVKASRFITHIKRLKDAEQTVPRFLERAVALAETLGIVLFQLPPSMKRDPGRLGAFLDALPGGIRYVVEFRHESWFTAETYALLDDHGVAFCIHDAFGRVTPKEVTGGCVYVRLHGATGMYQGSYGEEQLQGWADEIAGWSERAGAVYVYFNNDWQGFAVHNALRLREIVAERAGVGTEALAAR